MPSASAIDAIVDAVPITAHVPAVVVKDRRVIEAYLGQEIDV